MFPCARIEGIRGRDDILCLVLLGLSDVFIGILKTFSTLGDQNVVPGI